MAFNYSTVSPGDDILAAHPNNLFLDIKAAHHQEAGATKIVNADIDAAAAIAYSKLNLATSIVNADINAAAAIAWSKLSTSGSNITDIATRNHNDVQSLQGGTAGEYYHLTSTQHSQLTGIASEASTFFGATDMTGAEAEELTDGSETTKHKHALPSVSVGSGERTTVEGSGNEDVSLGFTPSFVIVKLVYPDIAMADLMYDGSSHGGYTIHDTGNNITEVSGTPVYLRDSGDVARWDVTISFSGTNLRLAFTANSPTANCKYSYLAIR